MGEKIAREYLGEKGYQIIDQNYKNRYAEIDMVAYPPKNIWGSLDREKLVFVEVKTRIGEQFGLPEDSLNKDKIDRLKRSGLMYAKVKKCDNYQIDAVCIVLNRNREIKSVRHYENITI